jgi:hypothetical protein
MEPKIVVSPSFTSSCMAFCEKELYMWSYFAKQFTKMALATPMELFMELKQKKWLH